MFNSSESVGIDVREEIRRAREYQDFSAERLKDERADQYVQLGTLEELETFHEFLMRDLYREEKPINFKEAFTNGREKDKKYYVVPLKRKEVVEKDKLEYAIDREMMKYVVKLNKEGYRKLQKPFIEEVS